MTQNLTSSPSHAMSCRPRAKTAKDMGHTRLRNSISGRPIPAPKSGAGVFLTALLGGMMLSTAVSAATVDAGLVATANILFTSPDEDQIYETVAGTSYQNDVEAQTSASFASASADVDLVAGTVKFDATATTASRAFGDRPAGAISSVDVSIEERFQVTGSGTVSFTAAIDGQLGATFVTSRNVGVRAQAGSTLLAKVVDPLGFSVDRVVGFDRFSEEIGGVGDFTGGNFGDRRFKTIDDFVSVSFNVSDGDFFDLLFSVDARAATGSGTFATSSSADFLNTATLSFSTSNGVSISPSNSLFLSGGTGAGSVAPVPLPAGLPLLLASLGMAWGVSRGRPVKSLPV